MIIVLPMPHVAKHIKSCFGLRLVLVLSSCSSSGGWSKGAGEGRNGGRPSLDAPLYTISMHLNLVQQSYMQVGVSFLWLVPSLGLYKPVKGNHTMYMHLRSYMMEGMLVPVHFNKWLVILWKDHQQQQQHGNSSGGSSSSSKSTELAAPAEAHQQ